MRKSFHPIPSEIENIMKSGTLEELDRYLNPGFAGMVFHEYSKKFLKVLAGIGIYTFKELEDAFNKCQEKKLSASARERQVVQGHYTYYIKELEKSKELWSKASDEQKTQAKTSLYLRYDETE